MGQQPNIELDVGDRVRNRPVPGVARRWKPSRPAEIGSGEQPEGSAFGVPGPDAGYALKLVRELEFELAPGEHRHDVEIAVAAIAKARAARRGRAPIAQDIAVGSLVLGAVPGAPAPQHRAAWVANVGHNAARLRQLVADVPSEVLEETPDAVQERIRLGWAFRDEVL